MHIITDGILKGSLLMSILLSVLQKTTAVHDAHYSLAKDSLLEGVLALLYILIPSLGSPLHRSWSILPLICVSRSSSALR